MAKYIPIDMQILPRESIKSELLFLTLLLIDSWTDSLTVSIDAGILSVRLQGASGLASADRNGKSDPYAIFELNGNKVFKSQVKKKTLAPEWNENFECPVIRRDNAQLMLEVWDWDRLGAFSFLTQFSPEES